LRRFDELAPTLAEYGVEIVALSKDTPEDAAFHRRRDELSLQLLSDPDLEVIRDFGLEHHKAIEFSTGRFSIFGIPLAVVPSFRTMAIPTTLLVDEAGIIRWIDQSDDYRLRSAEDLIVAEVKRAFDRGQPAGPTASTPSDPETTSPT